MVTDHVVPLPDTGGVHSGAMTVLKVMARLLLALVSLRMDPNQLTVIVTRL
jgi:hypothetical protein